MEAVNSNERAMCIRCGGPTSVAAASRLPIVCANCTSRDYPARTVLPAPGTPKVRSRWWQVLRGAR